MTIRLLQQAILEFAVEGIPAVDMDAIKLMVYIFTYQITSLS